MAALSKKWSEKLHISSDKHKKQSSGGVLSKDVPKNFAKFTDKYLCWSIFFNKVSVNLKLSEEATGDALQRKLFLKRHTGVSEPAVQRSSTK